MTTFSYDAPAYKNTQMMTLPSEIMIDDIKTTQNGAKIGNI